ncbi:XylR N-terminal domain-containing protein [Natribacillus halophilus]|uniref:Sugar diacid utilization regulator n=1 Tax=Natribacillus halophilus TaxID=549003 RepID=A0A1G8MWJ2_9BACI|nr:XylR N-terminal domain-containing protein [Natribacillus halophilus]SDI72253.1 Sugar diacid utilization regulator [Natribacillus halophilus]
MASSQNLYDIITDDDGKIYLDDERMILTSTSVFGTLRKDLMDNISVDRTKGFLIRYGWNLGKNDAQKVLSKDFSSLEEVLKQGPILHAMKGYTKVKRSDLQIRFSLDGAIETIHVEGIWSDSYEAEEYLRQFGNSESSVCHTLVGYASGYYSEICQQPVLFKEASCKASGSNDCYYIGKTLLEWEGEIDDELKYFENTTIVKELEDTYEKLLEERNNLAKTFAIHKRITDELVNENDLQSIADVIFQETQLPLVIEDSKFHMLANSGLTLSFYNEVYENSASLFRESHYFFDTKEIDGGSFNRLITPIKLKKKCVGYCSFIFNKGFDISQVDHMILERAASVCSLYMLNEKSAFEATERMKGNFLEQIINENLMSENEILNRGTYINMDLRKPYYIVALKYNNHFTDSQNELLFHEQVTEYIMQYFKQRSNTLIGQYAGTFILLIQLEAGDGEIKKLCHNLMKHLNRNFKEHTFKIGVSTLAEQIHQAPDRYKESRTALQMTDFVDNVTLFDDLSMAGMLIHSKHKGAVEQKARQLLGPLYEQREENAELIRTLYVFLTHGGNLEKSKKDLSISMSGLRYRIKRLEEMLGQKVRDPSNGYQLLLTLQVLVAQRELTVE